MKKTPRRTRPKKGKCSPGAVDYKGKNWWGKVPVDDLEREPNRYWPLVQDELEKLVKKDGVNEVVIEPDQDLSKV